MQTFENVYILEFVIAFFFKFTDINNDHMFILLNSGGQCKAAISITGDLHCWFWKGVIWLKYSYLC